MIKKHYEIFISIVTVCLVLAYFTSPEAAEFTIVKPTAGMVFHPRESVIFEISEGSSEKPIRVYLHSVKMQYATRLASAPYKLVFTIPAYFTGVDTLVARAAYADGTIVEKEVQINVVLPAGVVVKSISVDPTFILLKKLPLGSDANDIRIAETDSISVGGTYSDNVKRNITASTDGTTYSSSNEQVVTVSTEGDVTAQGVGTAIVTVRNGPHSAEVKVEVDPYKP